LREGQGVHGLEHLDLQNNWLSFEVCEEIKRAAAGQTIQIKLEGNTILDEVLNAVSHGLGLLLAIVGTVFLAQVVRDKAFHYKVSVTLYSVALHVLYMASMLLHSFHALGPVVTRIFSIFDHSAIYLLIAGSYCPFLWILFPNEAWALKLLVLLWTCAVVGIFTTAVYNGPHKVKVELSLYLLMGWSCVGCLGDMTSRPGPEGTFLLALGGLCYTGGVPFFIKDGQTFWIPDHTIWHFFVLAGSVAHYFAILWYTVTQ